MKTFVKKLTLNKNKSKSDMKVVMKKKSKNPTILDLAHDHHSKYKARELMSRLNHEFLTDSAYNSFIRGYNEVLLIICINRERLKVIYFIAIFRLTPQVEILNQSRNTVWVQDLINYRL